MKFDILNAVNDLKVKRSMADELSIKEMAKRLVSIGFECMKCGDCCRARSGDNTVILFPDEIRLIMDTNGMALDDICEPSVPQFIDHSGMLHCFEWVLKRHSNGDCRFIQTDNTCMLYQQRPWICSTYPFFLLFTNGATIPDIRVSECKGIGRPMKEDDAIKLAELLKDRLMAEITEEIRLLENLEGFEDWDYIKDHSRPGYFIAVHDSRGITYFSD